MKPLLILCLACTCAWLTSCGPTDPFHTPPAELGLALDELGNGDIYSGVVLLAEGDSVVLERYYGLADVDTGVPISMETRFNLASMNKMFTAVATLQLRDGGKLNLSDYVGEHLPAYPDAVVRDSVTIEHLLTHTSGLGDYFNQKFEFRDPDSTRTLQDYLELFAGDPLNARPGEKFAYSNAGYIVLGLLLAEVTGTDYYNYIQQSIFEPLGMENSGWYHGDTIVPGIATAYVEQDSTGSWVPNHYLTMKGSSAGGGFSTAGDLLKFAVALRDGQLVSPTTLKEMTDDGKGNGYGYGLSLRKLNDVMVYGHNGGFPGVAGEVDILPEKGIIAISLSNRSPRLGWATARSIIRDAIVGPTSESAELMNAERLVETYKSAGLAAAMEELARLEGVVSESQLISSSEKFDKAGERRSPIDILQLTVAAFPESWFPVSIMADLQILEGDTTVAIENYHQSLELNPDNQWAKDRLVELE